MDKYLFVCYGISKKARKHFLKMKEPFIRDSWFRYINNGGKIFG